MSRTLVVNSEIKIPGSEISLSYVRSSGPGGQNVNKVNSKAILRWNIEQSESLPPDVKKRFFNRFPGRVNQAGELVLDSDRHREQSRNIAECYAKLRQLILSVAEAPKQRKKSRPSRASVERRLQNKRRVSQKKQSRSHHPGSED